MTGVLFDGQTRRVSSGTVGHLWRELPPKAWRGKGRLAPLCGQTWDYPPSRLRADGITRACTACEKVAARLERLDREAAERDAGSLARLPRPGWPPSSP